MQLSEERYRTRWVILVGLWVVAAAMLFYQAEIIRRYLETAGGLGLRGTAAPDTPLKQIYPAFAADAQTWVRHALGLLEGNQLQLRFTTIDNAPVGREVHWNSAWAWLIGWAGWLYHLFTGAPLTTSVERSTVWLNPCVLLACIMVLSTWATRRAGAIAGMIVAVALMCHDRIYEGFYPTYVDHHGLLTLAVFGLMLGAIMMGGGWWQEKSAGQSPLLPVSPEAARSAAVFSAICGAFGMWVSAASTVPPIALVGVSGVIPVLWHGRIAMRGGARFDPRVWRMWGRVGASASLLFYLLEYFPGHLELRLEANHPFYALAWWGAGELIAEVSGRWLSPGEQQRSPGWNLAWPCAALGVVPMVIILGGPRVFIVLDPFLARLHSNYIQEFLPVWRAVRGANAMMVFQLLVVDSLPLLAGFATLTFLRRETPIIVWFATIAGLLFSVMAWWQSRWLLNASGVQICLVIVLFGCWTRSAGPVTRWLVAIALVGALYVPTCAIRVWSAADQVRLRRVVPRDAINVLYRDIAAAIRASQPEGEITLLSSPNGSTGIGYYGRFHTLGTLYWENRDGLESAAAIFSARPDADAAQLLRQHHVTHIAIVSEENFIQQYFELLHPGATIDQIKQGLGYKLLVDKSVPQWLETIPYRVPADLSSLKIVVMLFKVNFGQNLAEALYHVALAQIVQGEIDAADRTLDLLIAKAPQLYQPWLQKADLFLARHRWDEAADAVNRAISLTPAAERVAVCTLVGKSFYDQRQHATALRIYRASMAQQPTADTACYLAWILATSTDDSIRNGPEALKFAQQAVLADSNSAIYWESLAAALAENGRFAEAVAAADRAIVNSRIGGAPAATQQIFVQRLETLKTGQPLRN